MTGRHGEQGTTLVELVVVMLCCSIVMLAAGTVLLLGFRDCPEPLDRAHRADHGGKAGRQRHHPGGGR